MVLTLESHKTLLRIIPTHRLETLLRATLTESQRMLECSVNCRKGSCNAPVICIPGHPRAGDSRDISGA